jgi:uncharacterized membrane protein YkoI
MRALTLISLALPTVRYLTQRREGDTYDMTDKIRKILLGLTALAALALGGAALAGAAPSGGKDKAVQEQSQAVENESDDANEGSERDDANEDSERDDREDADKPVTATAASRAQEAAVANTGGKAGEVTLDSDKGATYEVEVTKANGNEAEVYLDDQFKVVTVDEDAEKADENEPDDDSDEQSGATK